MRKTKIVCTIGPATCNRERLVGLIGAGMDVARINFSHGNREEHLLYMKNIGMAAEEAGKPVAIMVDTRGPELRIGAVPGNSIFLQSGDNLTLTAATIPRSVDKIGVSYKGLPREIAEGVRIFLDDGLIELKAIAIRGDDIACRVIEGGTLTSYKGINISGYRPDLPFISPEDRADILFAVENNADFIAASFVRGKDDLQEIKEIVDEYGSKINIIAKIESEEGVGKFSEILKAADGIMVARGDLGVELAPERVPLIQKRLIRESYMAGKPVITATQMMESMTTKARPTRAEVSDVANAILDGTDAVMLSGETAIGQYPLLVTETMARIARTVETENISCGLINIGKRAVPEAIGRATCLMAEELGIGVLISPTRSGYTARMIAKFRPGVPIVATTPNERVLRQLLLVRGVFPLLIDTMKNTDGMIKNSLEAVYEAGFVSRGELAIITAGIPGGDSGTTNLIEVLRVK